MKKGQKIIRPKEGDRFGDLVIKRFSHVNKNRSYWVCLCDCGKEVTMKLKILKETKNPSCGCIIKINSWYSNTTKKEQEEFKLNCIKNLSHWEGECLIWDGSLVGGKVPKMSTPEGGSTVRRWLYFLNNPTADKNVHVSYSCGNTRCINIKHILLKSGAKCGEYNKKNQGIRNIQVD